MPLWLDEKLIIISFGNFLRIESFLSFAPAMETPIRIIEKAHSLFFTYGVKSVTMDEIAAHLGVSKKTIYQHFSDKDQLVEAVLKNEIEKYHQECARHKAESDNAIHEVFMAIEMLREMLANMNPAIIFELRKYHPAAFKIFQEHMNKFMLSVVSNNIERGIKEGLYREDVPVDIAARLRIDSIFIPFNQDLFPPTKYTLFDVEYKLMELFLFGLATAKGQKLIYKYKQAQSI